MRAKQAIAQIDFIGARLLRRFAPGNDVLTAEPTWRFQLIAAERQ
jgi:hypothetical protein